MTRIDWIVLRRVLARVLLTVVLFIALLSLVESLNTTKFRMLSSLGGPPLAIAGVLLSALWWSIGIMPVTVLIGTIAGVLDLQSRREFTIIQATGHSVWNMARAPLLLILLIAGFVSIGGETLLIIANRAMPGAPVNSQAGLTWLEQRGHEGGYILQAGHMTANPPAIYDVSVFLTSSPERDRIVADSAELQAGRWVFKTGTRYRLDAGAEPLHDFELPTDMTTGDLQLRVSGAADLTLPELLKAAVMSLSDSGDRAVLLTGLYRTFTLPFMVVGSMLIGFAVAGGYSRKLQYGNTILFGMVAGFVLFTLNEMAVRAGNADVLPPFVATAGPAFVSILVGVTALLYSQDGTIRR